VLVTGATGHEISLETSQPSWDFLARTLLKFLFPSDWGPEEKCFETRTRKCISKYFENQDSMFIQELVVIQR
jgi:hypothetical protein